MKETKRQELIRTVESLPIANQRVFRCMYGRDNGNRSLEDTLEMTIEDIVKEMPNKKVDWAQTQVYNTLLKALRR